MINTKKKNKAERVYIVIQETETLTEVARSLQTHFTQNSPEKTSDVISVKT